MEMIVREQPGFTADWRDTNRQDRGLVLQASITHPLLVFPTHRPERALIYTLWRILMQRLQRRDRLDILAALHRKSTNFSE
ncbi:MAG: hypothetical protein ACLRXC_13310 [[Clostridium] leptum]